MRVQQMCLDFANPRRFGGEGHMHVGNLAMELLNEEGLDHFINKVPYDERCRRCEGCGSYVKDKWDNGYGMGPHETCEVCKGKGKVQSYHGLRNAKFNWYMYMVEHFVNHSCDIKEEYSGPYYYTPKPK